MTVETSPSPARCTRTPRLETDMGKINYGQLPKHTTTTTQNSTNIFDSIDVLALAPHSAVDVAESICWIINYTVDIMATYPMHKGTGHTEMRKKYVVHVS